MAFLDGIADGSGFWSHNDSRITPSSVGDFSWSAYVCVCSHFAIGSHSERCMNRSVCMDSAHHNSSFM